MIALVLNMLLFSKYFIFYITLLEYEDENTDLT
jgi:hypothetical protein